MIKMARIAVVVEQIVKEKRWKYGVNAFESYMLEMLEHLRVPITCYSHVDEAVQASPDIIIAVLMDNTPAHADVLLEYADKGGIIISYGGLACLADKLGFHEGPLLGAGYAVLAERAEPVRYLKANTWIPKDDALLDHSLAQSGTMHIATPDGKVAGAALQTVKYGQGIIARWAIDIATTVVKLQQGLGPVFDDGIPDQLGTVLVRENILKADDRCAMDYDHDRQVTETGVRYFAYPYADWWREIVVEHLLTSAVSRGYSVPFLAYWPAGVDSVIAISHDSDGNQDVHADKTLQLLQEANIRSTWCMMEPGYSKYVYQQAKEAGHEIAFHYNALEQEGCKWDEQYFYNQLQWLKRAAGVTKVPSNKNHYTRFEGWNELFQWCERYGIEADQTRGPSKHGNIGFLFGTCHPYFPIADVMDQNRFYNVLEIGFLNQDLNHPFLYDDSVVDPFLDATERVGGVAHFLFHQTHLHHYEAVRTAFWKIVNQAKSRNLPIWTIQDVNDWERARRHVWLTDISETGVPVVEGAELDQPVDIYIAVPDGEAATSRKFGVNCQTYRWNNGSIPAASLENV